MELVAALGRFEIDSYEINSHVINSYENLTSHKINSCPLKWSTQCNYCHLLHKLLESRAVGHVLFSKLK